MLLNSLLMTGNEAAAYAVKQSDVDLITAYPITPQTTIVEKLAEYVGRGDVKAAMVLIESEHSALSACIGASAAGARVFTATSSQGLAYMHEVMYVASGLRLPIVMAVANRALSAPINIHCDHSDIMGSRDSGWVQVFCEDPQDVYDNVVKAFRLAEDPRVLLPVAVNFNGFTTSHSCEPVAVLPDEEVRRFLPRRERHRLSYDEPMTIGGFALPDAYFESKVEQEKALRAAGRVFTEVEELYPNSESKRGAIHAEWTGGRVKLICMGDVAGSLRHFVKTQRLQDIFDVLSVRLFRPFPRRRLIELLNDAELVVVMDRSLSPGAVSPPLVSEVKSALYDAGFRVPVWSVVYGLGGKPVTLRKIGRLLGEAERGVREREARSRRILLR
ncbi:MAG: pyruvate ferredoxin oxidoreductase [Aigarchaeota archaeon]|nr:pyruvate ferredoxin oxidoreductase [Aigarchaeota archaeon]MCS7127284.1 pyruvate ferredoxin oxidoreductase [Candidatus Calditenuaceae archaeon]MDW8042925.1 pyruvate ferredoxin oxidoreductase [Nitrososphaerota archaeon]